MKGESICWDSKSLNLDNIGRRGDPSIWKWPWSFCLFCRLDTQFQFWRIVVLEATFACFSFNPSRERYSLWMFITEWDSDVYNLPLKGVVAVALVFSLCISCTVVCSLKVADFNFNPWRAKWCPFADFNFNPQGEKCFEFANLNFVSVGRKN